MIRTRSRPEISVPSTVKSGAVRPITQDSEKRSRMRVTMASSRPSGGPRLLLGRQLAGQDRDEDDVVDPQHDLQGGQGQQPDPGLGVVIQSMFISP